MTGVANEAGGEVVGGEGHQDGSTLLWTRTCETIWGLNVASRQKKQAAAHSLMA